MLPLDRSQFLPSELLLLGAKQVFLSCGPTLRSCQCDLPLGSTEFFFIQQAFQVSKGKLTIWCNSELQLSLQVIQRNSFCARGALAFG
jgi:hypothetical protein